MKDEDENDGRIYGGEEEEVSLVKPEPEPKDVSIENMPLQNKIEYLEALEKGGHGPEKFRKVMDELFWIATDPHAGSKRDKVTAGNAYLARISELTGITERKEEGNVVFIVSFDRDNSVSFAQKTGVPFTVVPETETTGQ